MVLQNVTGQNHVVAMEVAMGGTTERAVRVPTQVAKEGVKEVAKEGVKEVAMVRKCCVRRCQDCFRKVQNRLFQHFPRQKTLCLLPSSRQ